MRQIASTAAVVLSLLLALPLAAHAKTLQWSGYAWSLRAGTGGPGVGNIWSDRNATVKKGNLLLSIVPSETICTSVELTSNWTVGFGRYRWVVNSDLSQASPASVLGLFTYSPQMAPSFGEQDFEFTRAWSAPPQLWPGWLASWHAGTARAFSNFDVPSTPPDTATITWRKRSISFLLTHRYHRVVFSRTVKTGLVPKGLRVHMNYWVANQSPVAARGAAPQMSIRSFTYTPAR
ncbi:MAG: hypothetical protein ACXVII_15260 [Solirubrobacteraceae bacterium]